MAAVDRAALVRRLHLFGCALGKLVLLRRAQDAPVLAELGSRRNRLRARASANSRGNTHAEDDQQRRADGIFPAPSPLSHFAPFLP